MTAIDYLAKEKDIPIVEVAMDELNRYIDDGADIGELTEALDEAREVVEASAAPTFVLIRIVPGEVPDVAA